MDITQVKIFPVREDKLKAFVSVVFDHCFMVNDIKVIQGKDGLFLSMPSRRKKSGEFKDVAHPLNNETRRMLEERVLQEYRSEVDDPTPRRPDREVTEGAEAPPAARAAAPEPRDGRPSADLQPGRQGADRQPDGRRPGSRQPGGRRDGDSRPSRPPATRPAPVPSVAPPVAAASPEKTLEEVQEQHLSDSFWSVS